MHEKSTFVFYTTIILYLITLFTVSYVGVYLTYIAIPIIIISGLIMKFTSSNNSKQNVNNNSINVIPESKHSLSETNSFLGNINNSLTLFNMKSELFRNNAGNFKKLKRELSIVGSTASLHMKYANTEKQLYKKIVDKTEGKIALIENHINIIEEEIDLKISKIKSQDNLSENTVYEIENITLKETTLDSGKHIFNNSNNFLIIARSTMEELNKKIEKLKEERSKINLMGIEPSVFIKNETNHAKRKEYQEEIDKVNNLLSLIDKKIGDIVENYEIDFLNKTQDKNILYENSELLNLTSRITNDS